MSIRAKHSLIYVLAHLLFAAVGMAQAADAKQVPPCTYAATHGGEGSSEVTTDPNAAVVCIYRPARFGGGARTPTVYVDDKPMVDVPNGSFFRALIPSGGHAFRIDEVGDAPPSRVDLAAGETYFVRLQIRNNWKGGWELRPVTPDEATTQMQGLKVVPKEKTYEERNKKSWIPATKP